MLEIFSKLSQTPFPVWVFAFGAVLILISLGADLEVVVNTTRMNKLFAGIIGSIAVIGAIWLWVLNLIAKGETPPTLPDGPLKPKDPFFKYYAVSAFLFAACFWVIMAESSGEPQEWAVLFLLVLTGAVLSVIVAWRYIEVQHYMKAPQGISRPVGLYKGNPNLFPYYPLLGVAVLFVMGLALHYTRSGTGNTSNRIAILWYMDLFFGFLAILRLLWEVVDHQAKDLLD